MKLFVRFKINIVRITTKIELLVLPVSKGIELMLKEDVSMQMNIVLSLIKLVSASIAIDFTSSIIMENVNSEILNVKSTPMVFVLFVDHTTSLRKEFVCLTWPAVKNRNHMVTVLPVKMDINLKEAIVWQESLD